MTALSRPVCFRKQGEDRLPFNLPDALKLVDTQGVGPFTRCAIGVDDIEPLLLTDSRLPPDSPTLARYRRNHAATLSTLLCHYVLHGRIMGARRMVELGARVNAHAAPDGGTALHLALAHGHRPIVEWLVGARSAQVVGVRNRVGATPFLMAVASNDTLMVRYLRTWVMENEGAAALARMLHETDYEGASAFVIAVRRDLFTMMAVLDQVVGAPVNAFEIKEEEEEEQDAPGAHDDNNLGQRLGERGTGMMSLSPVIVAIEHSKPPSYLRLLVTAGADLAAARKGRINAMAVAAANNRVPHICMLLRLGLLPDAEAFRQAALNNHPRALRFLAGQSSSSSNLALKRGVVSQEVDFDDGNGEEEEEAGGHDLANSASAMSDDDDDDDLGRGNPLPLLRVASRQTTLIPHSLSGSRALIAAVNHDAYQAAETLCRMGAKTTAALVEAVRSDRVWAVRLLLRFIVAAAASSKASHAHKQWPQWADTPLTLAVRLARTEIVHLMASAGLPPGMLNVRRAHDGRTALDLAEALRASQPTFYAALREAGALTGAELRGESKKKRKWFVSDGSGGGDSSRSSSDAEEEREEVAAAAVGHSSSDHDDNDVIIIKDI